MESCIRFWVRREAACDEYQCAFNHIVLRRLTMPANRQCHIITSVHHQVSIATKPKIELTSKQSAGLASKNTRIDLIKKRSFCPSQPSKKMTNPPKERLHSSLNSPQREKKQNGYAQVKRKEKLKQILCVWQKLSIPLRPLFMIVEVEERKKEHKGERQTEKDVKEGRKSF